MAHRLTEEQIDDLVLYITQIFSSIEMDLFISICKRLKTYNDIGGTLEWYLKKMRELGVLNEDAIKIISKYTKISRERLKEVLEKAKLGNFDSYELQKAFDLKQIKIDPKTLWEQDTYKRLVSYTYAEVDKTISFIMTNALQKTNQTYMDILNKAYVQSSTGIISYQQAIDNAIKELSEKGMTIATYKNGAKVSIETFTKRAILSQINKLQNEVAEQSCNDLGCEYVEVSSHIGARVSKKSPQANHSGWQGKIYHRGGDATYDGTLYKDFEASTGYGTIEGLGGVNCRHRFFPFFMGISQPSAEVVDPNENEKVYRANQGQRALERKMRALKKEYLMQKEIGNQDKTKELQLKMGKLSEQIDAYCKANNLKRKPQNERVYEQLQGKSITFKH